VLRKKDCTKLDLVSDLDVGTGPASFENVWFDSVIFDMPYKSTNLQSCIRHAIPHEPEPRIGKEKKRKTTLSQQDGGLSIP